MSTIKNFEELIDHLRLRGDRKRVAVVWAIDEQTQMSVSQALEVGFIDAIFVGNQSLQRLFQHCRYVIRRYAQTLY